MRRDNYLEKILTAKVYDVAIESPLEPAPAISRLVTLAFVLVPATLDKTSYLQGEQPSVSVVVRNDGPYGVDRPPIHLTGLTIAGT